MEKEFKTIKELEVEIENGSPIFWSIKERINALKKVLELIDKWAEQYVQANKKAIEELKARIEG